MSFARMVSECVWEIEREKKMKTQKLTDERKINILFMWNEVSFGKNSVQNTQNDKMNRRKLSTRAT